MTDPLLISATDFTPFVDISDLTVKTKKLDIYIQQAQFVDLKEILFQEFYYDLLNDFTASPPLQKYADLFNGSTYEYNGRTYTHKGLVPVLVYFAHSRYVINKNNTDTGYGLVQKTNDYSVPSPEKVINRLSDNSKSMAFSYLAPVILYLDHHITDFPLWYDYNYECFYALFNRWYPGTVFNHVGYRRRKFGKQAVRITGVDRNRF